MLVIVRVVVIVAAAALVIMIMAVRVSVVSLVAMMMVMIVCMCMAVAVVAGLTGRMVVSAVMLGLGCLLGSQQRAHTLTAVVIGLGGEFVDGWQWLEAHGLQASRQHVSRLLSPWKLNEVGTGLQGNACRSQQTSGAKQGSGLLAGDDMQFDAVHGDGLCRGLVGEGWALAHFEHNLSNVLR